MHILFLRPLLFSLIVAITLTTLPLSQPAFAARSELKIHHSAIPEKQNLADEKNIEEASKSISGTQWSSIIDHLLQKPLPDSLESNTRASIHINYPSTGDRRVDADIRDWVLSIATAFEEHLELMNPVPEETHTLEIDQFLHDDDLNIANLDTSRTGFELWGDYKIERPSPQALSVTFELWNYPASGEGNLDILTLNYSLLTGQRLNLVDIFENPDLALELMSSWSRKQLEPRLGATRRTQMLHDGTEPRIENFSSLTLTPEGICINFQPYQVAPWSAGIQKVAMPLSELMAAQPFLALWEKQEEK